MNTNENIITKLNKLLDFRAEKFKATEISNRKDEFLIEDMTETLEYLHPLKNRFALQYSDELTFAISFISSSTIAYAVRRTFNASRYKFAIFAGVGLPVLLSSASSGFHKITTDRLIRLDYNCKECFKIRSIFDCNLFANFNSLLFNVMFVWIGDAQIRNYSIFRKSNKLSYYDYSKVILNDIRSKLNRNYFYPKIAAIFLITSLISYLFAAEQQREFTIIFTRYFQSLLYEQRLTNENKNIDNQDKILI